MKKFILTFAFVLSLGVFTSCSVDELESVENTTTNKISNPKDQFEAAGKIGNNIPLDSISLSLMQTDLILEIDPPKPVPKPE